MQSETTLLSSIPERSVRDSYLTALLFVCISIKWLYSIVFVFVFVVIFLSFSVIQRYRSMSIKYFCECQIAVNVLIKFCHQIRSYLFWQYGAWYRVQSFVVKCSWDSHFWKAESCFSWLVNSDADIFFLQKTYSARDIENIWRKQWKGEVFFSHGSNHSRGIGKG